MFKWFMMQLSLGKGSLTVVNAVSEKRFGNAFPGLRWWLWDDAKELGYV